MDFIKQPNPSIGRTLYKADVILFRALLNKGIQRDSDVIDQRLLVMVAVGLLNRTFNLEEFLVAVVGQKWKFKRLVKIGETISVNYEIHEQLHTKRFIYGIKIELIANEEKVAEGIWQLMLKNKL